MSQQKTPILASPLARRMLFTLAAFGLVVAVGLGLVEVRSQYVSALTLANDQLDAVEPTFIKPLSAALWAANDREVQLILDGIAVLPIRIDYAAVEVDGEVVISSGQPLEGDHLSRRYEITHDQAGEVFHLGTLVVEDSLRHVYDEIRARVVTIFAYWLVVVYLVGSVAFLLLHHFVLRHILAITTQIRGIDLKKSGGTLQLERVKRSTSDELDQMVTAINEMVRSNRDAFHALNATVAQLQRVLRGANDGTWDWNMQTNAVNYSLRWKSMLGYRDDELESTLETWKQLCHPEDVGRALQLVQDYVEGRSPHYEIEFRMRHKDGHWVDILARGMLERDNDGRPYILSGTHVDISERKKAEAALRDSEALFRSVISVMGEGVVMQDTQDRVLTCNPAAEQILGLTRGQLMGLSSFDPRWHAVREDGSPMAGEEHPSVVTLRTGRPQENFVMGVHKADATLTWISVNSQPLFAEGGENLRGVVVSFRDITERKQAEADRKTLQSQLLQAQKMESIGHLTGGIAHDFNNMLGAILGYTELLKRVCTSEAETSGRVNRYIGEIFTAANRAKELIAQMLVFSRLSPDVQGVDTPVTLVQPVVKEVVHLLRSSIPRSTKVNYHVNDEDLRIRIHPVQLHQIVLNLAINARDAIVDTGRIDVTLARATAGGSCNSCHHLFSGDYAELTVTDTGAGIAEPVIERMFDPFFTTKDVGKGTGMGLSVVHGIVHAVGGHITVSSVFGRGTTIRVLFPYVAREVEAQNETKRSAEIASAPQQLVGLRILVVDDELAIASMLKDFLEMQGARVTAQTSSPEALAIFEMNPQAFDLIVSDENMPDLTGLEFAKRLLALRQGLPIILCTGFSDRVNAASARQNGIADLLYKPVNMDTLITAIRSATKGPNSGL